jgi:protein-S-isoprenylcysteine O-methyltransferase Ste14
MRRKIPSLPPLIAGGLVRRPRRTEARPLVDLSDFHPARLSDFGPALTGGLAWIMIAAFRESPKRIELRAAAFLTTRGPYAFSRNPMYVSELTLWLGWAVFYDNVAVLIGFAILFVALVASAPYEERVPEARFGDAYRAYKRTIPRWLGTRRRLRP